MPVGTNVFSNLQMCSLYYYVLCAGICDFVPVSGKRGVSSPTWLSILRAQSAGCNVKV